ncbi:MAG TPA: carboxypeptidase regulatory-like domain-containing protein [Vicinamibacterales bacterium]
MIGLLLLTLLQATPPAAANPQTQAPPAKAAQAPRPRPSGTATTTALLFITDSSGRAIENVTVNVMGPVDREVRSPASGATRIEGMRAGTYRVRFTHERFITFEKEISWRAGTAQPELAITLNAAPEKPAAPAPVVQQAPPQQAPPKLPPPGEPKTVSLPDFIEKNFITGREPQKQSEVGCSGMERAVLWQVREPWNGRQHEDADGMLYVVGGDGRLKLGEREFTIAAGAFIVVPRGTTYSLSRSGRNPVVILAILAGAPCPAD